MAVSIGVAALGFGLRCMARLPHQRDFLLCPILVLSGLSPTCCILPKKTQRAKTDEGLVCQLEITREFPFPTQSHMDMITIKKMIIRQ